MSALLEIKNVTLRRNGRVALDSVNLELPGRTLLGLLGPNGAGKTTLLQVILGELKPEEGEIYFRGKSQSKAFRAVFHIGYLPQEHDFDRSIPITGFEAVMMARYGRLGLFKRPGDEDVAIVRKSLERANASEFGDRPVRELSGGQLQRVLIARALAVESQLLMLDEPEAGVDMETADRFMKLLAKLRDELNLAIILVSHDVGLITRHADAVACINRKLHFHDQPRELDMDSLRRTFGSECEFLVHNPSVRAVEEHRD